MQKKIALAACSGMSPNGLVSRVACGDCKRDNQNITSICMGSTSADIKGLNNNLLKKQHIISINGCSGGCVNKILKEKGIEIIKTIQVNGILDKTQYSAKDPYRLDEESEKCVKIIKNEIEQKIKEIRSMN